jgi:hypothetical protein
LPACVQRRRALIASGTVQTIRTRPVIFNSMNGRDQQAIKEGDVMAAARSAEERGMAHLWQAVTEQIADPEGMRVHVMMAQKLLGAGKTCTRLLK